jgi:hypothetical protein
MSVDEAKVSISAGVFVEYKVEPGTITIEAKTAGGELGVLDLTTDQARQLQLALLEVLGEPLGVRTATTIHAEGLRIVTDPRLPVDTLAVVPGIPPAPRAPSGRPDTSDHQFRRHEPPQPGGLEMLASIDGQPSFSVLPQSVRALVRAAVALQGAWVGNDVPVLQRLYDDLLEAVDAVAQDEESECWLLSSAWLKARGEVG